MKGGRGDLAPTVCELRVGAGGGDQILSPDVSGLRMTKGREKGTPVGDSFAAVGMTDGGTLTLALSHEGRGDSRSGQAGPDTKDG